jgi:SNF family Na+-dependent transporter
MKMNNYKTNLHTVAYICAFVIGVILLWSIGRAWLDFESKLVVIAGVVGVAVSVIIFRIWNMIRQSKNHSGKKDN